jgi:flagellar protein FliS
MQQTGIAAYQQTVIATASRVQLIVLLYNGALQAMKLAQDSIRTNRRHDQARFLDRAMRIVSGLADCLDGERGGEIAHLLARLYEYVLWELAQANLRQDAARVEGPIRCLATLREAWVELARRETQRAAVGL